MPVRPAGRHHVPRRHVRRHRGVEDYVEVEELVDKGVPCLRALGMDQFPLTGHLAEPELLVTIIHLRRPRLHVVIVVERLEDPVEVGDSAESETGRV